MIGERWWKSCGNCRLRGCPYDDGEDACVFWERIPCPDCGGTLSTLRTNGERHWRHCYSCHFEFPVKTRVEDVVQLRNEIVLGSLFLDDYKNSFGYDEKKVCTFFDGYLSYIGELMEERGIPDNAFWMRISEFDTEENLKAWFFMFDDDPFES